MKIEKISVQNFRLLRDFTVDLNSELSLVVGKNNCGKTSLIVILDKMLNSTSKKINWEDINIVRRQEIFDTLSTTQTKSDENISGVSLQIYITYSESDSYENIQAFMMDLNPHNNTIVMEFSVVLPLSKVTELKQLIKEAKYDFAKFESFMKKKMYQFFKLEIRSLGYNPETKMITDVQSELLDVNKVNKVLKVRGISASRGVSNKENNRSLSDLSNKFYKFSNEDITGIADNILQEAIQEADIALTNAYSGRDGIFSSVFKRIRKFGGNDYQSELSIDSTLSEKDLLSNNTTLYYKHGESRLPETYNGLGYLNLYGMIFEIETILADIKREPADVNLIYIEEPESHTHPQLQYIFIKNIKDLLGEHINEMQKNSTSLKQLQTLITTHSSHIVSVCDFNDLIYFKREDDEVISKSFNSLKEAYSSEPLSYKFVKQYLTLNSSELFFADKVICIEGATERILLPTFMQRVDKSHPVTTNKLALLSQNISIIETGAHSQVFKKLFDFLGIKVLVITDIDPAKKNTQNKLISCSAEEATSTTNSSIKYFFEISGDNIFNTLISKTRENKIINDGKIYIAYQTPERDSEYQPASFEDAFISLNRNFIIDNKEGFIEFEALKNFHDFEIDDFYNFARNKINKKSAFASSILYFDSDDNSWEVPEYILEGLLWLKDQ